MSAESEGLRFFSENHSVKISDFVFTIYRICDIMILYAVLTARGTLAGGRVKYG